MLRARSIRGKTLNQFASNLGEDTSSKTGLRKKKITLAGFFLVLYFIQFSIKLDFFDTYVIRAMKAVFEDISMDGFKDCTNKPSCLPPPCPSLFINPEYPSTSVKALKYDHRSMFTRLPSAAGLQTSRQYIPSIHMYITDNSAPCRTKSVTLPSPFYLQLPSFNLISF